jgi:hypothetical protein
MLSAHGNLDAGVMLLEKPFAESELLSKLVEALHRRDLVELH